MRITENTFKVLKYLNWDKPVMEHPDMIKDTFLGVKNIVGQPTVKDTLQQVMRTWDKDRTAYLKNIDILSESFVNALERTASAFDKLDWDKEAPKVLQGTLIIPKNQSTLVYNLVKDSNRLAYSGSLIFLSGHAVVINAFLLSPTKIEFQYVNQDLIMINGEEIDSDAAYDYHCILIESIVSYYFFKKYAEIETREVAKNSRVGKVRADKVLNETKVDVNVMDCRWYTNITRTKGFSVRGHFRLQPFKENGEWSKKLIYINEFQKQGYTAKARKLLKQFD